jgi:ATP-dependent Lhr-like helicase
VSGFEQLSPVVQHHIVNSLGWSALRPLQDEAVGPILAGNDALLLAPTAGGKTEAALFPVLTRMASEEWAGTSVLYVCPLRALLNNLEPRVAGYASWLGRTAAVRHGDTGAGARKRQVLNRPDVLLTTPESLESMLVSRLSNPHELFGDVRAVVIDEVHAFAGDDRGWHLLAVLERISRIAGRPLQRVGLSATVGNAPELLGWLQGGNRSAGVAASVVAPDGGAAAAVDMHLDFVGSESNAAKVISALHRGEKRLVFADSRRTVETLALNLRDRGVETFVSHSSLSVDVRRQAEEAFSTARGCVIVSTSTLELGIDVGDLDRVLQIGSPYTVASVLQRLGRTGRRAGTSRSMLFLEVTDEQFLIAIGVLLLWSEGYVEPIVPPPLPLHIAAQQLLGLALQERRIPRAAWREWLSGIDLASAEQWAEIEQHLEATGHLDVDGDMLFVGPEAERRYGGVHYRDLMAVFTADPQFTVFHGREEIGSLDPMVFMRKSEGPRLVTLGGRGWKVNHVDWKRRKAFVEPSSVANPSKWSGTSQPLSYELCQAIQRVLLGAELTGVRLSARAEATLARLRDEYAGRVSSGHLLVVSDGNRAQWWNWAGAKMNATYIAALEAIAPELLDDTRQPHNWRVNLRGNTTASAVMDALSLSADKPLKPGSLEPAALKQLKFAEMLPSGLASAVTWRRTVADPA